jgi:hypothetical protein
MHCGVHAEADAVIQAVEPVMSSVDHAVCSVGNTISVRFLIVRGSYLREASKVSSGLIQYSEGEWGRQYLDARSLLLQRRNCLSTTTGSAFSAHVC